MHPFSMNHQKIARSIALVCLFLIPIFPLIVANSYFFPFITGKAFYFRILVEIAFGAWAILAFLDAKYRPRFTPLMIGVTLFTAITLIANLLGVNPLRSMFSNFERMEGWLVIAHLWMFYITSTHVFGYGEQGKILWHRWLNVSIAVAIIISIYGILQLTGAAATHQGSRVDATLGNSAYLAVYMLMHAAFAAYLYFVARAKKIANAVFLKWAYPALAVVFSFLVVATGTRGTTLGLIGGIMLACALYAIFGKGEPHKNRFIAAGFIGLIILGGFVFFANRESAFVQKYEVLRRMASISWTNTAGQARQYIWPMAIEGGLDRPILGWGQENFNYVFNATYDARLYAQEQWFDRAHSVFLDWFVATGFVGLFAYLALYILLIRIIWKHSTISLGERCVLTGLVAAYAIHNVFVFDNIASYVFFFALLGFGTSIGDTRHGLKFMGSKLANKIEKSKFSIDAVEYVVAPIVLVALVAGIYFLNVRPIQANNRLIDAIIACSNQSGKADPDLFVKALSVNSYTANQEIREQLIQCTGTVLSSQYPGPVQQNFFNLVTQEIDAQIAATPDDARIYVIAGSFYSAFNQHEKATQLLEKAHELSPTKQSITFPLATQYINGNKIDEAVVLLKDAYESVPANTEAKAAYATSLVIAGKEAEARKLFGDDVALFENERIARAYTSLKQYDKAIALYKKLIGTSKQSVQLRAQLAQTYLTAGRKWEAIQELKSIAVDNPELKDRVDATIKQLEAAK
jgi:O-antigen ligase/tetratricopeptide (TPR) repeat protein